MGSDRTNDDSKNAVNADDSAARHGHGAHGRGRGDEELVEPTNPQPDGANGSDRGGSAAWGSERSGGSTIDKRPPQE